MVDKNMEDVREIMIEFQNRIDVLEAKIDKIDCSISGILFFVLVILCFSVFVASHVFVYG